MSESGQTELGFPVDLPAGGTMYLLNADEVAVFEAAVKKYREDYAITKTNDLAQVGALATQQIIMLRAQQLLAGLEPEYNDKGHPTGNYKRRDKKKASDLSTCQKALSEASDEIRKIEKALGVDKKTRESGGKHTVANYISELKKAAHQYGVRVLERVTEMEEIFTEAEWKLRLLANGDDEDKKYHDLTHEKVCEWMREKMLGIREKDQEFARKKGQLYAGKL